MLLSRRAVFASIHTTDRGPWREEGRRRCSAGTDRTCTRLAQGVGHRLLSPRREDWHREAAAGGGGGEGGDEHGKGREEAWDGKRRRRPKIFSPW